MLRFISERDVCSPCIPATPPPPLGRHWLVLRVERSQTSFHRGVVFLTLCSVELPPSVSSQRRRNTLQPQTRLIREKCPRVGGTLLERRRGFPIPTYYHDRVDDYEFMTKERYEIFENAVARPVFGGVLCDVNHSTATAECCCSGAE